MWQREASPCLGELWRPGGTTREDGMKMSCHGSPEVAGEERSRPVHPPRSLTFAAGEAQVTWRKPGCICFPATSPLQQRSTRQHPCNKINLGVQPVPPETEFGLAGKLQVDSWSRSPRKSIYTELDVPVCLLLHLPALQG